MPSIYHHTRTDRQYKATTGLTLSEFEKLAIAFACYYTPKQALLHTGNKPVLTDKKEALFFILHYLKAYPTLLNMGVYFNISEYAVSHYLELLKPCLKAALHQVMPTSQAIFANQQAFDTYFAGVEDLVIDVTEIPIERAANQEVQQEYYSGKKNSIR